MAKSQRPVVMDKLSSSECMQNIGGSAPPEVHDHFDHANSCRQLTTLP